MRSWKPNQHKPSQGIAKKPAGGGQNLLHKDRQEPKSAVDNGGSPPPTAVTGSAMPTYRQLVIKRCECSPYFAHALICSSAPINAEDQIRADLSADQADENLKRLKDDLRAFLLSEAAKGTTDISDKIKVVLNIHGYNMPLKSIEEGFEQNQKRFNTDTSDTPQTTMSCSSTTAGHRSASCCPNGKPGSWPCPIRSCCSSLLPSQG